MRASARVAVATLLVTVVLGGCSSGTAGVPTSFKSLQARIVTKVPSAFVVQSPDAFDTGPSDLAKAIKDDGEPNAGKLLRAEKFVRGYQRIWIGPEHAQIIVFLYQFESDTGAHQDFARSTRIVQSKAPPGAHKFVVRGVPAKQALGIAGADKDAAAAVVYFTKGVFNVQVNCNAVSLPGLQAQAVAIAKDQYSRLGTCAGSQPGTATSCLPSQRPAPGAGHNGPINTASSSSKASIRSWASSGRGCCCGHGPVTRCSGDTAR